jgi:hypothetical protein
MALDHAPARRRALRTRAHEQKSALFDHRARRLVLDPDAGQDLDRRGEPETGVDHRQRSLGGEALAPVVRRQHEAER